MAAKRDDTLKDVTASKSLLFVFLFCLFTLKFIYSLNLRKSGCLKNYCECYEAKIPCTSHCKCVGCKNFDENDEEDRPSTSSAATTSAATVSSSTNAGNAAGNVIISRDSGPVQAIPASRFLPQVNRCSDLLTFVLLTFVLLTLFY